MNKKLPALLMTAVLFAPFFFGVSLSDSQEEVATNATVTVKVFVDITMQLNQTGAGVDFGQLDPGQYGYSDNNNLTVEPTTNVDVDIWMRSSDFTHNSYTILAGNFSYSHDNSTWNSFTTGYVNWTQVSPMSPGDTTDVYYRVYIPPGQRAGTYTGTFYTLANESA